MGIFAVGLRYDGTWTPRILEMISWRMIIGLGFTEIKASEGDLDSSLIQVQIAVCICSW
jgi:hypothetical protein